MLEELLEDLLLVGDAIWVAAQGGEAVPISELIAGLLSVAQWASVKL